MSGLAWFVAILALFAFLRDWKDPFPLAVAFVGVGAYEAVSLFLEGLNAPSPLGATWFGVCSIGAAVVFGSLAWFQLHHVKAGK